MMDDFPLESWTPHPGGRIDAGWFKLLFLAEGRQEIEVDGRSLLLEGPSVLCLNEAEAAVVPRGTAVQVVQFLPELINGSLTIDRLRRACPQSIDVSVELDYYWAEAYLGPRPGPPLRLTASTASKVAPWLERLDRELRTRSCAYWKAWARSYLSEVLFSLGETLHRQPSQREAGPPRAERLAEYLRREFHRSDLTLEGLSREFATNRTTLQNEFRSHTGRTIAHYLRAYRLSMARDLLEGNNRSITEVATLVGFRDLTGFERAFFRHYGMTPRTYRRSAGRGLDQEAANR